MTLHREIRPTGPYVIPLKRSRLYLDDVQDILSTVESFAKEYCQKSDERDKDWQLFLQASKATADTVEDLREANREELEHVSIRLTKPYIVIDLWRQLADITTDYDNLEARALADDIASFVESRRSWSIGITRVLLLPAIAWCFAIGNLVIAIMHSLRQHQVDTHDYSWAAAFLALGMFIFLSDAIMRRRRNFDGVVVVATKRAEKQRISGRARRDIIVAIAAAVISAVIVGTAGLWAGLLAK